VRPLIDESEDRPVTLSTIHSAKGLEWYAVFVPHLIDGVFPSSRSLSNIDDMEEERRLFYVACSRAKEQLYLTLPSYVFSWDQTYTMPSRFLIEVEKGLYRVEDES
jgi:DNA helicase-2/ATP-dependent DNA helicase PcrA